MSGKYFKILAGVNCTHLKLLTGKFTINKNLLHNHFDHIKFICSSHSTKYCSVFFIVAKTLQHIRRE